MFISPYPANNLVPIYRRAIAQIEQYSGDSVLLCVGANFPFAVGHTFPEHWHLNFCSAEKRKYVAGGKIGPQNVLRSDFVNRLTKDRHDLATTQGYKPRR